MSEYTGGQDRYKPGLSRAQGSCCQLKRVSLCEDIGMLQPGDMTLCWWDFLPTGLGESGQLRESRENEKPEVTSESTEGVGGSHVFRKNGEPGVLRGPLPEARVGPSQQGAVGRG